MLIEVFIINCGILSVINIFFVMDIISKKKLEPLEKIYSKLQLFV